MTICIGALCSDGDGNPGRSVVVCSDRMVTMGTLQEFEHEVPKIYAIANQVVALVAGDALAGSRLCRSLTRGAPAAPLVRDVA